ncbi:MAG: hypothetical protein KAR13_11955 [Desulfobulbaceae bacterium]|nr:hypothetical protein [Desulfobulbaceae bacterium]
MCKKTISILLIAITVLPAIALAGLPQPGDKDYPPYYMLITTNLPHILDMLKKPEVFKLSEIQRQQLEEIKKETLELVLEKKQTIKTLEIRVRDNLFVKEQGRKGLKPLLDEIEEHRRLMTEIHVD